MKVLYDIECYPNMFMLGCKNYETKELWYFEISEYRDDSKAMYKFLTEFNGFAISFNGIHYDKPILSYFVDTFRKKKRVTNQELKDFSDIVINAEQYDEDLKPYKYILPKTWIDVDLFMFWSRGIRQSKKISLKSLGVALGHEEIQELPYHHTKILTESEIEEVKHYNLNNDLGILDKLTKSKEQEITLRRDIRIKMNFGNEIYSWDTPKIASEILLDTLSKADGRSTWDLRKLRYEKPTLVFRNLLEGIDFGFETKQFLDIYQYVLNAVNTFSYEFSILKNDDTALKISIGMGGIHSINKNEKYVADDKNVLITSDIASLYPNLIRKLKCFRFSSIQTQYEELIEYRLNEIKPNVKRFKGTDEEVKWKKEDTFVKLILNGVSGLIDMEYSYLYNPEKAMLMRLCGQMILLRTVEKLLQNNYNVISVNTDGIEAIVPKDKIKDYYDIVNGIGEFFDLVFEHEQYKAIYYRSVNSYIAIYDNGKTKKKGEYVTSPNLEDGWDELVIPKVLEMYYTKDLDPRTILSDPYKYGLHIYDFTLSKKIAKSYTLWWNNTPQQNLNRFYVSKKGAYLYKQKAQGKKENVLKGCPIMLYNKHEEKRFEEYFVDTVYYLKKIEEMIYYFDNNQLNLF
jgi:hypothetical protein